MTLQPHHLLVLKEITLRLRLKQQVSLPFVTLKSLLVKKINQLLKISRNVKNPKNYVILSKMQKISSTVGSTLVSQKLLSSASP